MHHVFDLEQQAAAKRTTWVREGKVLGSEAAGLEQGDGQCVAQHQRCRGRGGRGQVERAGFLLDAGVEIDLGGLGQG
ncbi:hypothetical protein D3C77_730700 [compost metagenome]